ncbi:hypothetical protein DICSQDRAFT_141370 [Dichomitus squalens LYAD-421 SS1]|uniref:Uncharacterized protein n=1 Tax=Dichomitus squalens (strain LYAD-421) TaxID=732165 RepID=R7SKK6_DICSQ|nr:uncharacterized protein DICSQDRAFT_141370 [Dichomitus squalens LYAD-421 SS1]EJF56260.1 hypothetical protein DICSQDRAFT_141370 [Dichomitus squalens LYAD-421 SS1]
MSSTSSAGWNTLNILSGAISFLTIVSLIWAFVRDQHPETRMKELESTLKDTEALLRSLVEEGLLDHQRHVHHFESHLILYRSRTESFREETCIAIIDWRKVLKAWLQGLSKRIATLSMQVKQTRAEICETSAEARLQLMQQLPANESPTWHTNILKFWRLMRSSLRICSATKSVDGPTSTVSATPVADATVSPIGDGTMTLMVGDCACAHVPSPSPSPTCEASSQRSRPSSRVLERGIIDNGHSVRTVVCGLRRLDRELAAQGIAHPLLTDLVRATKKWSPASSRASYPRRSRRKRNSVSRADNAVILSPLINEAVAESEEHWLEEDTVCEA